ALGRPPEAQSLEVPWLCTEVCSGHLRPALPRGYHGPAAPLAGRAVGRRGGVGAKGAKKLPSGRFTGGFFTPHGGVGGGAAFYLHGRQFWGFARGYGPGPASAVAPFCVNTKAIKKRRRKPGRPHTGHDPMVGVRLPRKMLKKIAKVADALSA